MKRTSFLIIIFLTPFILTAIKPISPDLLEDPSPRQELPGSYNGLEMSVVQPELEAPGDNVELDIKNTSRKMIGYGEFFYMEKKVDGKWFMLSFDDTVFSNFLEFDNYGKVISSEETDRLIINPGDYHLTMDAGHYRIVKAFRHHGDEQVFWLTDEFRIL